MFFDINRTLFSGDTAMTLSVGDWLKELHPDYDGAVTVDVNAKEVENKIAEEFGDLRIRKTPYTYKRYGYGLSELVAQKFALMAEALELGFSARLTNCGMAAIKTVFDVLGVGVRGQCIASNVLYSETKKLLRGQLPNVLFVNPETLLGMISEKCPPFIFIEPVGNGWGMPVCDLRAIFINVWNQETTLIVDNTLLSCANLNPFRVLRHLKHDLGEPRFRLVYVESLSKHYRAGYDDPVTAGVIVAPDEMMEGENGIDAMIARNGSYLQFPCLREMPFDLFAACEEIMGKINENGRLTAKFLQKLGVSVSYPDLPHASGVIYFVVDDDIDGVIVRMQEQFGPRKGSFGHLYTTWVPFGKLIPGNPPGLIRLAVGSKDDIVEIMRKLNGVFS